MPELFSILDVFRNVLKTIGAMLSKCNSSKPVFKINKSIERKSNPGYKPKPMEIHQVQEETNGTTRTPKGNKNKRKHTLKRVI